MVSSLDTLKKSFLSVFIIVILGLQIMPIITKVIHKPWDGYYWPIIDYPMYMGAHKEGEHVQVGYSISATLSSGIELFLSHNNYEDLGLSFFQFQELCTKLLRPDGYLYASEFTALHHKGDEIVKLDIYNYPVIVTRDGPKKAEAELLKSIILDSGLGGESK